MSDSPTALEYSDEKALALGCVAFGALLLTSMSATGAPITAPVSEIANLAVGVLLLFGWLLPIISLRLLARSLCRMIDCWRRPKEGTQAGMEAAVISLGSLILLLVTGWAYLGFGIGRIYSDPPLLALWLTLALLVGGAGLLFLQRWAAVLVCGTGWWCLWRLMEVRGTASVDLSFWKVAFWLASLVLPMTLAVIANWRYLKSGRRRGSPSSAGRT